MTRTSALCVIEQRGLLFSKLCSKKPEPRSLNREEESKCQNENSQTCFGRAREGGDLDDASFLRRSSRMYS